MIPAAYSHSPKLLKGALIKLSEDSFIPVEQVIVFQYNPTELTRSLSPSAGTTPEAQGGGEDTTAEPYDPSETFRMSLVLDATDALEFPESNPVEVVSGIGHRIAALEMLLFPQDEMLLGQITQGLFGDGEVLPRTNVPVVLFVWGPGKIAPVRVTSLEITEEAFSPTLFPTRATVAISLSVLRPSLKPVGSKATPSEELAIKAYELFKKQKGTLATASLANNVKPIMDLLPF